MVNCHSLSVISKSIRVSDELAAYAEEAAAVAHRSPPQQIEHWAQIGRVLEPALSYHAKTQVKRANPASRDHLEAAGDPVCDGAEVGEIAVASGVNAGLKPVRE